MKHRILAALVALGWSAATPVVTSAAPLECANGGTFVTHLSGDEEVPPVDTQSQGQVLFKLNAEGDAMEFKLTVANIEGITQAHIHCGPVGENGSVTVFLFGFDAEGVTLNGRLSSGTITEENVLPVADTDICPGGITTFEDLLAQIEAGNTYVNVHTLAHPPGEIRGQLETPGS